MNNNTLRNGGIKKLEGRIMLSLRRAVFTDNYCSYEVFFLTGKLEYLIPSLCIDGLSLKHSNFTRDRKER